GGRVSMNARVVEIFSEHGFVWGGTWTRPDGMHFEWANS
ncbi:MAG: M15 family metallopeptidase, partial [Actinomycetia bacterium]|nr:M15 family metallopeptidase [Actinomycetes bacterium]